MKGNIDRIIFQIIDVVEFAYTREKWKLQKQFYNGDWKK